MKVYIVARHFEALDKEPEVSAFFFESIARSYVSSCKKLDICCSLTELNIESTAITETALNVGATPDTTQGDVKSDSSLG